MTGHQLTVREQLLCAVVEGSRDGRRVLLSNTSYPGLWVDAMRTWLYPSGAGYASALRGLENKGLIQRPPNETESTKAWRYYYVATEDGLLEYEKLREAGKFAA